MINVSIICYLPVHSDITHGCEDIPIQCVNEIDDEIPVEFTYIKENCYDVGNYVDSAMSHIAVSLLSSLYYIFVHNLG